MNALIKDIDTRKVDKGKVAIWWIGQEGFVLKTSKLIIYIDPYLSDFAERITKGKHNEHVRMTPAPMQADEIKHGDRLEVGTQVFQLVIEEREDTPNTYELTPEV